MCEGLLARWSLSMTRRCRVKLIKRTTYHRVVDIHSNNEIQICLPFTRILYKETIQNFDSSGQLFDHAHTHLFALSDPIYIFQNKIKIFIGYQNVQKTVTNEGWVLSAAVSWHDL